MGEADMPETEQQTVRDGELGYKDRRELSALIRPLQRRFPSYLPLRS